VNALVESVRRGKVSEGGGRGHEVNDAGQCGVRCLEEYVHVCACI
jgi:hypothetical protein